MNNGILTQQAGPVAMPYGFGTADAVSMPDRQHDANAIAPDWRNVGPGFASDYAESMRRTAATATVADTLTTLGGTYPGSTAYFGGVLLPDGRVFCVPYNATTARIYDPATNTVSIPNGTYPGGFPYYTGVLLQDGRVFCVPYAATTARIYDPATDTLTTPGGTYPGGSAYDGGVVMADGRVFCVPANATSARIYDPRSDTVTTPSGTYPGSFNYVGGVLMRDGRVFIVPYGAGRTARIYDPVSDVLSDVSGTFARSGYGVLLIDGRVFACPGFTQANIYNPVTNTFAASAASFPTGISGCVLLPDGKVFMVPFAGTSSGAIYDPATDTVTIPSISLSGTNPFANGVAMLDGRVFFVPHNSTTAVAYGGGGGAFARNVLLSAYQNKT